jgi:replicative DNA helicase
MLNNLRESGNIEQDADIAILLYRPEKYDIERFADGSTTKNVTELIIAKHRDGSVADVRVSHNQQLSNYYDYMTQEEILNPYGGINKTIF